MYKTRILTATAALLVLFGLAQTNVHGKPEENRMSNTPAATMQATDLETNKALVRQVVDVLSSGDYKVLNKIVAENYVQHGAGRPSTRKGLQATFAAYRAAFPDIKWTIEYIAAEGDKVLIYTTLTGTQKAVFNGIPATNRFVTINTADVYQITNGLIAAHWDVYDQFGLLTQLGVLPKQG